jgi:hypothetical protein
MKQNGGCTLAILRSPFDLTQFHLIQKDRIYRTQGSPWMQQVKTISLTDPPIALARGTSTCNDTYPYQLPAQL